jgi:hypothetical protein
MHGPEIRSRHASPAARKSAGMTCAQARDAGPDQEPAAVSRPTKGLMSAKFTSPSQFRSLREM